jgi:hypothetical protein
MKKLIVILSLVLLPIVSTQSAQADWRHLYTPQQLDAMASNIKQSVIMKCYVKGVPVLQTQPVVYRTAGRAPYTMSNMAVKLKSTQGLMTKEFVNNPTNAEYMKWWYSLTEPGNFPHPETGNKRNEFSPCVGIVNGTLDIDKFAKDSLRWVRKPQTLIP